MLDATGQPDPNNSQRVYDVRTTVVNPTSLPTAASTVNLATVKIQIANNPGRTANPFASPSCPTYFIFAARNKGSATATTTP